jgi:hypothetical protein
MASYAVWGGGVTSCGKEAGMGAAPEYILVQPTPKNSLFLLWVGARTQRRYMRARVRLPA